MIVAVGVDGARGGWAVACLLASGATRLELCADIEEIARLRGDAPVAIDMPIGLLDSVGFRCCDAQARKRLGRRASCVFAPPARYLLAAAGDYAAIRALVAKRRQHDPQTRGLSVQAAGIARKVAELDCFVTAHPDSERWLFECHPELCFLQLNNNAPLDRKRSPHGRDQRQHLLTRRFPDAPERIAAVTWPRRLVDRTDLLDAYAALTTADRCTRGQHEELGNGARDAEGVPMRMAI